MKDIIYFKSVLMVPDLIDCVGDTVSREKIVKEYNRFYGKRRINIEHNGINMDVMINGMRLLTKEETLENGFVYPKGTWIVELSTMSRYIIDGIESGELTGLSIEAEPEGLKDEHVEYLLDLVSDDKRITLSDYEEIGVSWNVTGFGIVSRPCLREALILSYEVEELNEDDAFYEEYLMAIKSDTLNEKVSQSKKISSTLKVSKIQYNICTLPLKEVIKNETDIIKGETIDDKQRGVGNVMNKFDKIFGVISNILTFGASKNVDDNKEEFDGYVNELVNSLKAEGIEEEILSDSKETELANEDEKEKEITDVAEEIVNLTEDEAEKLVLKLTEETDLDATDVGDVVEEAKKENEEDMSEIIDDVDLTSVSKSEKPLEDLKDIYFNSLKSDKMNQRKLCSQILKGELNYESRHEKAARLLGLRK